MTEPTDLVTIIENLKNEEDQERIHFFVEELVKSFDEVVNLDSFYILKFDYIRHIFINYINRINDDEEEEKIIENEQKQKIVSTIKTFFEHLTELEKYKDETILLLKYIKLELNLTIEDIIKILSSIKIIPLFKQLKELNQLVSPDYSKELLEKDQIISQLQEQIEALKKSSPIFCDNQQPITIKMPPKFLKEQKFGESLCDKHCLGISFGEDICSATDHLNHIDYIPNSHNDSYTPCYIKIDNETEEILIGKTSKYTQPIQPQNVVHGLWKIIGKKMNDPDVIQFCKEVKFKVVSDSKNNPIIEIPGNSDIETKRYTITQLISYLFTKSGGIFGTYRNITGLNSFYDVHSVITVPDYYNEEQRNIIYESAKLANLQYIQIISESIASLFGIYWDRKKLCDGYYLYIYFYEEFRISIVEKKGDSYQVLGFYHDPNINHECLVQILSNYLLEEYLKKHPDIKKK